MTSTIWTNDVAVHFTVRRQGQVPLKPQWRLSYDKLISLSWRFTVSVTTPSWAGVERNGATSAFRLRNEPRTFSLSLHHCLWSAISRFVDTILFASSQICLLNIPELTNKSITEPFQAVLCVCVPGNRCAHIFGIQLFFFVFIPCQKIFYR